MESHSFFEMFRFQVRNEASIRKDPAQRVNLSVDPLIGGPDSVCLWRKSTCIRSELPIILSNVLNLSKPFLDYMQIRDHSSTSLLMFCGDWKCLWALSTAPCFACITVIPVQLPLIQAIHGTFLSTGTAWHMVTSCCARCLGVMGCLIEAMCFFRPILLQHWSWLCWIVLAGWQCQCLLSDTCTSIYNTACH